MKYILVATNQDVLLFKLLTFLGVPLTETCYQPRRATARDFTVGYLYTKFYFVHKVHVF